MQTVNTIKVIRHNGSQAVAFKKSGITYGSVDDQPFCARCESKHLFKIYITDTDLFYDLLDQNLLNLANPEMKVQLIGADNCADMAADIISHQPHFVIHNSKGSLEDDRLIHIIHNALPDTCFIALGNFSSFFFRLRSRAAGANHVFDLQSGLSQIIKLLRPRLNKLN